MDARQANTRTRRRHGAGGFTLIEMMVTLAIIAILAAVAVPAYTDHVMRGHINEATSALVDSRVKMEQFFQDNRQYTNAGAIVSPCNSNPPLKYFTVTCPVLTTTTYTISAAGTGDLAGLTMTINEGNQRASTVTGGSAIANAGYTGNASCWVTRKGGVC